MSLSVFHLSGFPSQGLLYSPSSSLFTSVSPCIIGTPSLLQTYLCLLTLILSPDPQALCLSIPSSSCLREAVKLGRVLKVMGCGLSEALGAVTITGGCCCQENVLTCHISGEGVFTSFCLIPTNPHIVLHGSLSTGSRQQAF